MSSSSGSDRSDALADEGSGNGDEEVMWEDDESDSHGEAAKHTGTTNHQPDSADGGDVVMTPASGRKNPKPSQDTDTAPGGSSSSRKVPPPRPRRRKKLKHLDKDEDFKRFDRPDMYADDVFPIFGMNLMHDTSGLKNPNISGYKLPPHCKVLRLSVDGGVPAGGRELFERIQAETIKRRAIPDSISILGEKFDLEMRCPDGDELSFTTHSQDIQWIGDRSLGTICVSHHQTARVTQSEAIPSVTQAALEAYHNSPRSTPPPERADRPAWQDELTYRSWHMQSPLGADGAPPPPEVIPGN